MSHTQSQMCPAGATIRAASGILRQCGGFIGTIDEHAYTRPCDLIAGSTIGQHVRHSLDHFAAAIAGASGEVIDYDHRERETPIERSPAEALRVINGLLVKLDGLDDGAASMPVRIRVMLSGAGDETELDTTLGRELAFAAHHAVHHHAMIGAIALDAGVALPPGFGKAPSTLNHEGAEGVGPVTVRAAAAAARPGAR